MNLTDRRQDAVNKTVYPRALANEIEDHAVGYWLAVAQRENSRFRIRYVNAEPGSVRLVHNRPVHACTPGPNGIFDGDGSNSWRQVVAIHPLKEVCGLAYVWQQLIMAQPTRLRRGGGASNGDRKKAVDEGRRRSRTAAPLINTTITLPHENTPLEVCRFHLRGLCTARRRGRQTEQRQLPRPVEPGRLPVQVLSSINNHQFNPPFLPHSTHEYTPEAARTRPGRAAHGLSVD
jgi:hypothetical protein